MSEPHTEQKSSKVIDLMTLQFLEAPEKASAPPLELSVMPHKAEASLEVSTRPISPNHLTVNPSMLKSSGVSSESSRRPSRPENGAVTSSMPVASDISAGSSSRHSASGSKSITRSMPEPSHMVADTLDESTSTRPGKTRQPIEGELHVPKARHSPCDHGSDEFSHTFKRIGPSPTLEMDSNTSRGLWVCSGEVISKDSPKIRQWLSSSALQILGSKFGTLLCESQLADLSCREDPIFEGEAVVVKPEDLSASCFTSELANSKQGNHIRGLIERAAEELQDDFIQHLPRTSFEEIPDGNMMIKGFPSGIGTDQDHPFSTYEFALCAVNTKTLKEELRGRAVSRAILHVDPALPSISCGYCAETNAWNITYHISSLYKRVDGVQACPYGMLSVADQFRVTDEIMASFEEASSEDILPMLQSALKSSKRLKPSKPFKSSRSSELSKSPKPRSLLEWLQPTVRQAFRYSTFDKGYVRGLLECRTALGKQAGTAHCSSLMIDLDQKTKVQVSIKMSPHVGYFDSCWGGVGEGKVSKLASGAICYSTSSCVSRFYRNTSKSMVQVPGSQSGVSHEFCEQIASELARQHHPSLKSEVDDATLLTLASTQRKDIEGHYHPREQQRMGGQQPDSSTLDLTFTHKGRPDFIVSFDPHPGMPTPLSTQRLKELHHRLATVDRSLQERASEEGKKPCKAIDSAFLGGSWEDNGVPDEHLYP